MSLPFEPDHKPLEDYEYPDPDEEDFGDDDDEELTSPCPSCGTEVYEDSPRCPACGEYVTASNSLWSGKSPWWIVLGMLGILAVVATLALQ